MSLAPSVAVPRSTFNPLPLYIALFCLLWSFAFVAGKIGVTYCPPLILLNEQLTWRKIAGLGLGVLGVGLIVWHRLSVGTDSLHGILFTFASLASIVAGTILFKLLAPKGSLWIGNGVQNIAAGIVLIPFALTLADIGDIVPNLQLLGAFAFLTLGGSVLAYVIWFHLLRVCGATAASAYHFLMPPLGMLFAWMVLGEHLTGRDLLGIIPVALGIYLVTRPARIPSASR
jgi:drug/metabolite transporter (DMT)-like permease